MELVLRQGRWTLAESPRQARRPRLPRTLEWTVPWGTWLVHGGYFHAGVERPVCRALHRAARRGVLYRYAPPPPLRIVSAARGDGHADEYRFRSPFVSHQSARNQAAMRHYRSGAAGRPLVVWNHGTGACARMIERLFVSKLLAAGLDVVVPVAPGAGCRRDRVLGGHWAATVGAALSAIVQAVHDNVAIESWARGRGYRTVAVSGIGIGGTVAALAAATTTRFDACVPMLAGAHPGRLWLPPRALARAVNRRALARTGIRRARTLVRLFDPVAPERLPPPRRRQRCAVIGFGLDTLVPAADVRDLALHWRVAPLFLPRYHVELPACVSDLAAVLARVVLAA